jgi:ribose transport system permease protein
MKRDRSRITLGLDRFSGLYIWALIIIVFTVWEPHLFPTMATVTSVASEQAIVAILGLAVLIPLTAGAYDLSVGSTINFVCILVTELQVIDHWSMASAIIAGLVTGLIIGTVNGLLVVRVHIDSFIATLGMATIIAAFQTIISGNSQPLAPTSSAWVDMTQTTIGGFQIVFFYMLVLALLLWWVLERTPIGRFLYATGGNREAARLSGVKVGRWTGLSLVGSSLLASIGGIFYASLIGPSLSFGQGMLLPAFAAAFLGSTQLKPGRFNVWGTVLAVYVLATGVKGLQLVTGVQWLNDMFNGVALLAAVGFAVWRQRAAKSRRTAGAPPGLGITPPDPAAGPPDANTPRVPEAGDDAAPQPSVAHRTT